METNNLSLMNIVSVLLSCKKLGIEVDKCTVLTAVERVMQFFTVSKTVGRRKAESKATSCIVKPSGKRVFNSSYEVYQKFWKALSEFEDGRSHGGCVIVSLNDKGAQTCVRALEQPALVISGSDLGSRDFSKQLAQIMLQPMVTICFEVEEIGIEGSARLITFLECCKSLFDSRLRIVIMSTSPEPKIVELLEKTFVMSNLGQSHKKPRVEENISGSVESQKSEPEISQVRDLVKEAREREDDLKRAKIKIKDLVIELEESKSETEKSRAANEDLQGELEKMKDDNLNLEVDGIKERDEHEKLTERVKFLEAEVEAVREDKSGVEKTILSKDLEIKELRLERTSMNAKMKALEDERLSLKEVLTDHDNSSMDELKKAKSQNDGLKTTCRNQEQELLTLQHSLEDLQKEFDRKECEHEEVSKQYKNKINNLRTEAAEKQMAEEPLAAVAPSGQIGRESALLLSTIRNNLDKHCEKIKSSVTVTYRSIKDLKCDLSYSKLEKESKCEVEIVKGKNNIMMFPEILKFSGHGENDAEAKIDAFKNFIVSVREFSDQ